MFNIHDKITGDFIRKDNTFNSAYETIYIEDLPNMFKPTWDGEQWIETATPEEIGELTKPQPHEPTVEERLEQTEELLKTVTMAFTEYVFMQGMSNDN